MFRNIRLAPIAILLVLVLVVGACRGRRVIVADSPASGPVVVADAPAADTPADAPVAEAPAEMPAAGPGPSDADKPGDVVSSRVVDGPAGETPAVAEEPAAMPEEEPAAPAPEEEPVPAEPAPAEPTAEEPAAPAGPDAEGFADEISRRNAVEQDRARFLVRQKLEAARVHVDNYEYAKAEKLLLEARKLQPGNRDVVHELRIVEDLLGRRRSSALGYADQQAMIAKVRIDEQKTKAAQLSNLGRMHLANGRFDDAIENFEQSLFIMTASPYDIDWGELEQETSNGLRNAQSLKEAEEAAARRRAIEGSLQDQAMAEEEQLMAQMRRLESWMGAGVEAFGRDDFEKAGYYAGLVLNEQPDNTKAKDLQLASNRASHAQYENDYLREEKLRFREWMNDITNTRVPQDKILVWPSQKFWDDITEIRKRTRPQFGNFEVDAEAAALKKKVNGTSVNISVDNQEFQQVVQTLQIQTGYNIMIDNRVAADINENPVQGLHMQDVAMGTVLNLLQAYAGDEIVWTTQGNVIKFTRKDLLAKNLVVQIHSVADLTSGLTDFIPPKIQLVSPDDVSDEENPLFGAEGEEPIYPYGQIDELIELIKGAVDPAFWENSEGEVSGQGDHALVVKATPEVQEKVDQFLNDLRGFAGIVVTVETRFLEVGDNFLRDVGVDFRGLGNQTPGQLVNLDDVTNGLEDNSSAGRDNNGGGLTTGAALNPSAGVYFGDGADGDFRGRTEGIFDRPLGNVLSSVGGTTLTLSYLDDTEFSMVVRATEKSAKARTLTAPTITVYNTQRANLTVVNQLSYIQDFDVEVAQTSFIADPIVGIIQDGLTLDVRPTVSNDRRYITLELQPTVADLIEPIPTFATTLASSFAPVIIQLPELRLQQARTTVRIPDRGSILIGGLKNITTVDRQSESPFLGKLPLLSFLFSRKGRSDEISHLMILVRAHITDLSEQEERLMGR